MEGFLKDSKTDFIAGTESVSVADLALFATYTTIATTKDTLVDLNEWPMIKKWAETVKNVIPNYAKANGEGEIAFQNMIRQRTFLKI